MKQALGLVSMVVRDYDEALAFFVGKLGFDLVEDTEIPQQSKRWVVVSPPGAGESRLLLARASSPEQESRIGAQTGGRVFLFLHTDDFWRDYERYKAGGIEFVRPPKEEPYGTVAVFKDLYGNLWDLLQPGRDSAPSPDSALSRASPRAMRRTFTHGLLFGLRVVWPVLSVLIGAIAALGLVVGSIEGWSLHESIYFAFVSGLTIGYGDFSPGSLAGRTLAIVIGICGVLVTALVAAVAVKAISAVTAEGDGKDDL